VQQNQCGILNGAMGDTSSGAQVVVSQTGSQASAQVQGIAGTLFVFAMGSDTFTDTVSGTSLDMSINGTMAGSSGTCAFTRSARLRPI
jgi:hypothetical protein